MATGLGLVGAVVASLIALAPVSGASSSIAAASRSRPAARSIALRMGPGTAGSALGGFTPAAADSRLAALIARSGIGNSAFRFTPASSFHIGRSVTVAVRARSTAPTAASVQTALVAPTVSAIAPVAYNLGVALGWRKFAVSGNVGQVDIAGISRNEAVDVGVSYTQRRMTTRVQLGAERTTGDAARLESGSAYSVDLGSSYALTRNFNLTAGLRYRSERDRLLPLGDNRRDSQAVYVGTAVRF